MRNAKKRWGTSLKSLRSVCFDWNYDDFLNGRDNIEGEFLAGGTIALLHLCTVIPH